MVRRHGFDLCGSDLKQDGTVPTIGSKMRRSEHGTYSWNSNVGRRLRDHDSFCCLCALPPLVDASSRTDDGEVGWGEAIGDLHQEVEQALTAIGEQVEEFDS